MKRLDVATVGDSPFGELYGEDFRAMMHCFVGTLDEKQRRLFYGLEARRLGHGSRTMIVEEFATSFSVVRRGERELLDPSMLPGRNRVRHEGGGQRLVEEIHPEILQVMEEILEGHIAGDPMNEGVRWTDLHATQIRDALAQRGFGVSDKTVTRLLKKRIRSGNRLRRRRSTPVRNATSSLA